MRCARRNSVNTEQTQIQLDEAQIQMDYATSPRRFDSVGSHKVCYAKLAAVLSAPC